MTGNWAGVVEEVGLMLAFFHSFVLHDCPWVGDVVGGLASYDVFYVVVAGVPGALIFLDEEFLI